MLFKIKTRLGDELSGSGHYSSSSAPWEATSKHLAEGISINGRWISKEIITNWHDAQVPGSKKKLAGTKKTANPAQVYGWN